jgi:hypothetical protein
VVVLHHATGHAKGAWVVNRRGPQVDEPADESMSYLAMCSCGVHAVHVRELAEAMGTGAKVIKPALILM